MSWRVSPEKLILILRRYAVLYIYMYIAMAGSSFNNLFLIVTNISKYFANYHSVVNWIPAGLSQVPLLSYNIKRIKITIFLTREATSMYISQNFHFT